MLLRFGSAFIMYTPTKFANTWFADNQRALANTIALGSNTVGILIGSFLSPQIVTSSVQFVSEMCLLNLICLAVSFFPTFMAGFIMRSTPVLPPSYSAMISFQEQNLFSATTTVGGSSSEWLLDSTTGDRPIRRWIQVEDLFHPGW